MFRYTKLTFLREVLTVLASIALLMPFYFLVTTALKTESDVLTGSSLAPPNPPTSAIATAASPMTTRSIASPISI